MALPDWMVDVRETAPETRKKGREAYVEKTLSGVSSLLEESLLGEKYARMDGFLQRLEPGYKLASMLVLIGVVSLLRGPWTILLVYGLTLVLARVSRIPLGFFIARVWVFIPIFAGLIVLPSVLNVVTPGEPILSLGKGLYVTKPGLDGAALLVLRVAASVSLAVLLVLTTPWQELLRSLRSLKVPRAFVMVLAMTYRYILLLLKIIQDYYMAKRSRQIRPEGAGKGRGFVASRMGALFMKSVVLSEEVHSTMVSRGYTGEVRVLGTKEPGARDYFWMGGVLILGLVLIWSEMIMGAV